MRRLKLRVPWNKVGSIGKELSWIGAGQIVAVAGSMVGVRVLTNYLSPQAYGEVALALTAGTLLQNIFTGPCCNALQRFYAPSREKRAMSGYFHAGRRLLSEASIASAVLTAISLMVLLVCGQYRWAALVASASIFALISGCSSALDTVQNAARQRKVVAWHQGIGQWLRIGGAAAAITWFGPNSLVAIFGYAVGAALILVSQYAYLRRTVSAALLEVAPTQSDEKLVLLVEMRSYALPFLAWGIFAWVQFSADRWALGYRSSADNVGFYAVLTQLGLGPVTMLSGLVVQLLTPILYDRAGTGTDKARVLGAMVINIRLFYGALAVTGVCTLAMLILHRVIFAWLVAPAYWGVSYLLPWIGLSGGIFAATQILSLALLLKFDSTVLLWPKIFTAALATGLFFAVAASFGVAGIVYTSLLVSTIYMAWVYGLTVKSAKQWTAKNEIELS